MSRSAVRIRSSAQLRCLNFDSAKEESSVFFRPQKSLFFRIITSLLTLFFLAGILFFVWLLFVLPNTTDTREIDWAIIMPVLGFLIFGRMVYLFRKGGTYQVDNDYLVIQVPAQAKDFRINLKNINSVNPFNMKVFVRSFKEKEKKMLIPWGFLWANLGLITLGLGSDNLVEICLEKPQMIKFNFPHGEPFGGSALLGFYPSSRKKSVIRIRVDECEKFIEYLNNAVELAKK